MSTRILVVDDDVSLAEILRERLRDEGFEVNTAADGCEGYLAYLRYLPEVILTDIQMPGENGLELMDHVWTHNPEIRAIYMTGGSATFQSNTSRVEGTLQARFLRKPFTWTELMTLLSEYLEAPGERCSS